MVAVYETTVRRWRGLQDPAYEAARSGRGARLRELRRRVIESGEPLMSLEEIMRFLGREPG
jgi:hypothetical protein